jgi:hypothetical protein
VGDIEDSPRDRHIGTEAPRTVNGLCNIWDVPPSPDANLVAKDAKAPCPPRADGPLGHNAATFAGEVGLGRLFDHVCVRS